MKARIDLITILTDDVPKLATFYHEVLGFEKKNDVGEYVEFESENVRFAICARSIMADATGHDGYKVAGSSSSFELAFPCDSPKAVDKVYDRLVAHGATPVKGPANMPWGQRTAFFADPDGNVHEIFANLAAVPV